MATRSIDWCGVVVVLMLTATASGVGQERTMPSDAPPSTDRVKGPTSIFAEPSILARGVDVTTRLMSDSNELTDGLYTELSNLPTGSGWISAGPGYRHWLLHDRMFIDGSAAISWRAYKMAQARFELPRLARSRVAVGTHVRWQDLTQVTYFGEGPDSLEDNRSEYRLKSTNISAYVTVRARPWLAFGGRVGWLDRPSVLPPAGAFQRGHPASEDVFSGDPVFTTSPQPSFAYREASVTVDTRNHAGHPTTGGLYRTALTVFTDQDDGMFSVRRTEAEAAHFIPISRSRVTLALHGWLAVSDTSDGGWVPFYLEPSLGGHNTVRGYIDYRFHDRNSLAANVETRFAVFTHLDAAVFVDAGNVAARFSDLNLDKRSYGVGWRLHSRESTLARFDMARGAEGWKFLFRLNDPLQLSRLTKRLPPLPFVP